MKWSKNNQKLCDCMCRDTN